MLSGSSTPHTLRLHFLCNIKKYSNMAPIIAAAKHLKRLQCPEIESNTLDSLAPFKVMKNQLLTPKCNTQLTEQSKAIIHNNEWVVSTKLALKMIKHIVDSSSLDNRLIVLHKFLASNEWENIKSTLLAPDQEVADIILFVGVLKHLTDILCVVIGNTCLIGSSNSSCIRRNSQDLNSLASQQTRILKKNMLQDICQEFTPIVRPVIQQLLVHPKKITFETAITGIRALVLFSSVKNKAFTVHKSSDLTSSKISGRNIEHLNLPVNENLQMVQRLVDSLSYNTKNFSKLGLQHIIHLLSIVLIHHHIKSEIGETVISHILKEVMSDSRASEFIPTNKYVSLLTQRSLDDALVVWKSTKSSLETNNNSNEKHIDINLTKQQRNEFWLQSFRPQMCYWIHELITALQRLSWYPLQSNLKENNSNLIRVSRSRWNSLNDSNECQYESTSAFNIHNSSSSILLLSTYIISLVTKFMSEFHLYSLTSLIDIYATLFTMCLSIHHRQQIHSLLFNLGNAVIHQLKEAQNKAASNSQRQELYLNSIVRVAKAFASVSLLHQDYFLYVNVILRSNNLLSMMAPKQLVQFLIASGELGISFNPNIKREIQNRSNILFSSSTTQTDLQAIALLLLHDDWPIGIEDSVTTYFVLTIKTYLKRINRDSYHLNKKLNSISSYQYKLLMHIDFLQVCVKLFSLYQSCIDPKANKEHISTLQNNLYAMIETLLTDIVERASKTRVCVSKINPNKFSAYVECIAWLNKTCPQFVAQNKLLFFKINQLCSETTTK